MFLFFKTTYSIYLSILSFHNDKFLQGCFLELSKIARMFFYFDRKLLQPTDSILQITEQTLRRLSSFWGNLRMFAYPKFRVLMKSTKPDADDSNQA